MSVALNHLWQWLDKGTVPPHADRIYMDYNTDGDGSLMALDEFGNVKGGIRTTYVDVPTQQDRRAQFRRRAADQEPAPVHRRAR